MQSATRIVFVLMAIATIVLTFMRIIDAKDFMMLASMVFSFYFTRKQNEPSQSNGSNDTIN